jgi:glucosamine--fructose-6-phosphate aminotransferase (isomerizing)
MCGIIAAVAQRDVVGWLLAGLVRMEYRGYDSAGIVVVDPQGDLQRLRRVGKVQSLIAAVEQAVLQGHCGVAHTRWATHGPLLEANAHPLLSHSIAVAHNGIIENHQALRLQLQQRGYEFTSDTDTEVIAHLVHWERQQQSAQHSEAAVSASPMNLRAAVQRVIPQLRGSYGIVVLDSQDPTRLVAVRCGSPLVIGCSETAHCIASDQFALPAVMRQVVFLQEGDLAEITDQQLTLWDHQGQPVERPPVEAVLEEQIGKGSYQHYMQKELYEQPSAIRRTLSGRLAADCVDLSELGDAAERCLQRVQHVQIVACGTAYHAGLIARYWFEAVAKIPCDVEIASEFRYRQPIARQNSLFISLSQSGETADTLAALRLSQSMGYLGSLALCNNAGSTLVRESDFSLITHAGREIGVASTKAFTTQLVLLLLLVTRMGRLSGMSLQQEQEVIAALHCLPERMEQLLQLDQAVEALAAQLVQDRQMLFVGRGVHYPVAMEGALKLKELAYLPAEAYAAGELKHGPLALIDAQMPVIALAPYNELSEKLQSNIEEICARGGRIYLFADQRLAIMDHPALTRIALPAVEPLISPILYTVPLQLLAYYIALLKGADIDQPRHLAKSVTVE